VVILKTLGNTKLFYYITAKPPF